MSKLTRRIACLLLLSLLLVHLTPTASAKEAHPIRTDATAAVLIEAESGDVIWAQNAQQSLPMASTTKIMTALVALETASPEQMICVDPAAVGAEGSSVYLAAGEELTLEQLLYALLLESANDAALAIAIGLCGSVEAFADRMNQRATEMGLQNTHFVNPHGLDDKAHYTTAHELALITREALKNPTLARIVSTRRASIPHADDPEGRLLINHNKLLRSYPDCIGVKTGYTTRSGRCLVSAAARDGVTLIAVTLNASSDWQTHADMLDYGFSRYHAVLLADADCYRTTLPIVGGTRDGILLSNVDALSVTLPKGHGSIRSTVEAPHFLYAPTVAGETVGTARFYCDTDGDGQEELIGSLPLIACETVAQAKPEKRGLAALWQWICEWFKK